MSLYFRRYFQKGFTPTSFPVALSIMGENQKSVLVSKRSSDNRRENLKGFTLIEIAIVVGFVILLSILTFSSFSNLNNAQALDKDILSVVSVLNEARSLTLSSKENSAYGVHFETNQVVLFKGSTYSSSASTNVYVELNRSVSITAINITGGEEVVFERLTGKALQTGTVTLTMKQSPNTSRTITISESGIVEATS